MESDLNGILIEGELFDFNTAKRRLPPTLRGLIVHRLMDAPPVRHAEPTMVLSLDDEPWRPSQRLFELAAQISVNAPKISHPYLSKRQGGGPRWYEVFPGEHYHLLTVLCQLLRPGVVWEFGTDTGMGTVALLEGLNETAKVYTVDIDSWMSKTGLWLTPHDFVSGRLTQVISDMKAPDLFVRYRDAMADAELLFVDGPKDGFTEAAFLEQLATVPFRHSPIIVFDDIRLMNMLAIWRSIHHPKMDLTSFAHWSGTGLIDWTAKG